MFVNMGQCVRSIPDVPSYTDASDIAAVFQVKEFDSGARD